MQTLITEYKKSAQREIILRLLKTSNRHCGEFLKKGIAQYNARIYELRKMGYLINYDNKKKVFEYCGMIPRGKYVY